MTTTGSGSDVIEAFVQRARAMDDDDRRALARARGSVDETFHVGAWRTAIERVAERSENYVRAWVRIGGAFVPDRLEELVALGSKADPAELAEWQSVARLARAGIDDALLAIVAADAIPPPHVRELHAPWKAMLAAGYERAGAGEASAGG